MFNKNLKKICRICMQEGSREIFHKSSGSPATENNIASPDRLLEKLRYITLIKINENDNLPTLLCDLCTIQLNVAYNFKRKAIDTNTKLHQYIIENGLEEQPNNSLMQINHKNNYTTTTTTTSLLSTVVVPIIETILPPSAAITQPSTTLTTSSLTAVKTEPIDYEILSNITIDTNNTDETDDCDNFIPNQSMVRLNDNNFLRTSTSDMEYVKNYLQSSSSSTATVMNDCNSSSTTTTTTVSPIQISPTSSDATIFVIANVKSKSSEKNPQIIDKNEEKSIVSAATTEKINNVVSSSSPSRRRNDCSDANQSKLADEKSTRNVAVSFKKRRKTCGIPYALRRLSADECKPLTDSDSNYKLRKKNEKLIDSVAISERQLRNLNDKVLNPLNKLTQRIKQEKTNRILRQKSNRLLNSSNSSSTTSSDIKPKTIENDNKNDKVPREKIIKSKKIIQSNVMRKKQIIARSTKNLKKILIKIPIGKRRKNRSGNTTDNKRKRTLLVQHVRQKLSIKNKLNTNMNNETKSMQL